MLVTALVLVRGLICGREEVPAAETDELVEDVVYRTGSEGRIKGDDDDDDGEEEEGEVDCESRVLDLPFGVASLPLLLLSFTFAFTLKLGF